MPEHDPLVLSFTHLRGLPRAADALQILRRVASLVKPLMRQHRWTVGELAEFYPDEPALLGLNINRGHKILLRLRYPTDPSLFLPINQIADTMLHELVHIVHGPHDDQFQALWNQLRDEHMDLALKAYTGEHFLSKGNRLGYNRHNSWAAEPAAPARQLAAAAAERRHQAVQQSTAQKPNLRQWQQQQQQQQQLALQHQSRLLRPAQAQPRSASQAALTAQPSALRDPPPTGHRHSHSQPIPSALRSFLLGRRPTIPPSVSTCATAGYTDTARRRLEEQAARNGFRTAAEEEAANDSAIVEALREFSLEEERTHLATTRPSAAAPPRPSSRRALRSLAPPPPPGWSCSSCTLHNPASFLCCDACGKPRDPGHVTVPVRPSPRPAGTRPVSQQTSQRTTATPSPAAVQPVSTGAYLAVPANHLAPLAQNPSPARHVQPLLYPPIRQASPLPPPLPMAHSTARLPSPLPTAPAAAAVAKPASKSVNRLASKLLTNRSSVRHVPAKHKKVTFTPSTHGSVRHAKMPKTAQASASHRAEPSPVWQCTFCSRTREREMWSCDLCGKIKESWQ